MDHFFVNQKCFSHSRFHIVIIPLGWTCMTFGFIYLAFGALNVQTALTCYKTIIPSTTIFLAGLNKNSFVCNYQECFVFPLQVTCLSCKHKSNTVEPFWDLSLEFPERYHSMEKGSGSMAYQRSCTLTEMLSKFTEMEALEGSIYACNHCNSKRSV